jgi:eukaryotic-like serine/threonine-protein kinase
MNAAFDRLSSALADRYRIERELGQGGMATVFLAEDLKHKRRVAVKVLKPELAAVLGAERFVQEITTTAALQHPHILPLFDSGEADGFLYYVMPFIDGETLRAKLDREKQLGVEEAVRIAQDVASALHYAHDHGVIHRDIKPENILLHDGRPMVADFGIALAVSAAAGGRMTETGLSLGTPHYMSPEQATAEKEISARSDVYSLGSVLYEMLTGEPPHMGNTAQQIIMKIITEPAAAVTKLRKSVPRNVADAVARSLEKLPADRFTSAKEFAAALGNDAFRTTDAAGVASRGPSGAMRARALVGTTGLLLVVALWGWLRPSPAPPVIRYGLALPASQAPTIAAAGFATPAPDGSFLVYTGRSDAGDQLWVKRRDSYVATPLLGTAGVASFTISPDGKWVAFLMNGRLSKIPLDGGSAEVLSSTDVGAQFGVAWLSDGSIVHATRGARGLMRVPADGGEPTLVWQSDSLLSMLPNALPDGRGVIFVACRPGCIDGQLWGLDLSTNQARLLLRDAYEGSFVPSGHLVYTNAAGALMAAPFDPRRLTLLGAPQNTGERLGGAAGNPRFRVSASGMLVVSNDGTDRLGRMFDLVWVDRTGRETSIDTSWTFRLTAAANNHGWALSPDGSRLAIGVSTDAGDDIWVKPLPRGAPYRVTFDPFPDSRPRWRSDGRHVTFRGDRTPPGLYQRLANGAGTDSLLVKAIVDEGFVTADDRWIVVRQGSVGQVSGGRNVNVLRMGTDTAPRPLLSSEFDEMAVAISPDGKWIAYQSDETGPTEVFIRSFPDVNASKKQVSSGGGFAPLWSRDGRELFYLSSANNMMVASVGRSDSLDVGVPEVLFPVRAELRTAEYLYYTPWDVGADGRFIMARMVSGDVDRNRNLVVVENWFAELKARLAR